MQLNCLNSSGLTIPLQITLSDIKLSAFIILVFSRQKGLTLVFRNDPLESLKVSSTFDSIPFVRDYLQKEIEGQLRVLLMEEVPAIIHRLSLRLWVPEYSAKEDEELLRGTKKPTTEERVVDPFASPPQNPLNLSDGAFDSPQVTALSIDSGSEYSSFSQKNMLRLAALTDSHRTLSLFTPSIRDAVFRAWAGPTERGEAPGVSPPLSTPTVPSLSRMQSYTGAGSTTYTFSEASHNNVRPTLSSFSSAASGLSLGASRHVKPHAGRKRKNRVVNLRRTKGDGDDSTSVSDGSTMSTAGSSAASEIGDRPVLDERQPELATPPRSPSNRVKFRSPHDNIDCDNTPTQPHPLTFTRQSPVSSPSKQQQSDLGPINPADSPASSRPQARRPAPFVHQTHRPHQDIQISHVYPREKADSDSSIFTRRTGQSSLSPRPLLETPASGILEQAWMMKMAGEIARRVQDEKSANGGMWDKPDGEEYSPPPPAYWM